MSYRAIDSGLVTSLENNDPHTYVHLIKFEKPSVETEVAYKSGAKPSRRANTYSYLTDGGFAISFDDGSVPSDGSAANGAQTYIPGKVLSVGTVSETIEAKASTMSLQLAATVLSTSMVDTFTITSTTVAGSTDLLEAGFSVGDTVEFVNNAESNHGVYVRIDGFSNENKTFTYTTISGTITTESSVEYTLSFASEEIASIVASKEATAYSNYLNREVFIYRAHINPTTGALIGSPFLIFKGIITGSSFDDNVLKSAKITWTLTSHWGDFVQVSGRLTSDHAHRGLDVSGVPSEDAVIRPEYVGDLGFKHAEQAINIVATYQTPETRYKLKRKSGLSGLFGGKKLVEYTEMVDRDVDLEFNLGARYIPVVYGVQKATGIPFFADGDKADSQKVYVAQAISEGPIHGILDLHIDSNPVICINEPDAIDRASGGNAAVFCVGRADRGDVLNGGSSIDASNDITQQILDEAEVMVETGEAEDIEEAIRIVELQRGYNSNNISHSDGGAGILHEKKINLESPLDTELQFHAGLPNQAANSFFTVKGVARQFKVQDILYRDQPGSSYWGPSHQVLDTAYTTMNFTIGDGEFTIPDYEFVVKGRVLDCFNYDHSYSGSGTHTNFKLGQNVTLHKTKDDTQIGSEQVQIIDKWSFYNSAGNLKYRFRLSKNLQLQDVRGDSAGDIKSFYMKSTDGNNHKWYFSAHDNIVEDTQATPAPIETNSFQNLTTINSGIAIQAFTSQGQTRYKITGVPAGNAQFKLLGGNVAFDITPSDGGQATTAIVPYYSYQGTELLFHVGYNYSLQQIKQILASASSYIMYGADAVKLDNNSSSTNDEYNDLRIKITQIDTSTGNVVHEVNKTIVDYIGSTKVAFLNGAIPFRVNSTSEFNYTILGDAEVADGLDLFPASEDKRVSINPAIQLLDYLTNKRYGKGLDIDNDIDLPSFLSVARSCDEQSKVSIITAGSTAVVGQKYRYPETGDIVFQGTVESKKSFTYNSIAFEEITFKDVIGKIAYRWNDYRAFKPNEVLYYEGTAFTTNISSAQGALVNAATRDSFISNNALDNSTNRFRLAKVGDESNDAVSIVIYLSSAEVYGTASGNPVARRFSPTGFNRTGYSLYDSDDCKYWVYLGWDEPEQRYVTRHQTNLTVDTAQSVFANINAMLEQFGGMLRYSNGKYSLAIKAGAPADSHFTTDFTSKDISEGEIIGSVKVQDSGSRKTFNSLNATIVDPANKFGGRGITFMNSEYLKQDRGIKKQGNYNIPGISNYFNARMNIKQQLDESRYGLTVKFTLDQKGYLLLAGDIIRLTYSRFGWSNKYFRINSLNFQANGLVQVVADEHNNNAYIIDHLESSRGATGLDGGSQGTFVPSIPGQPATGTAPSQDKTGYIELNWTNGGNFNPQIHRTEIARAPEANSVSAPNSDLSNVKIIAEVQTSSFLDNNHERTTSGNDAQATKFDYWVRHRYNTTGTTGSTNRLNQATPWTYLGEGHALPTAQTEIEDGVTIGDGGMTFEGSGNTGAHINSAGTNFSTGNDGFFLGWDNTGQPAHKFFVGDRDGSKLTFDGADLALTGGEFTVTDSGGTVPSISGTTISGAGILLKADGDVLFGDSAGHHIFFDQSEGTITLGGDVVTENITAGTITTDKLAANSITANKIQANTINAREINADAINANHIVAGEITADAIAANAITADKVTANSVVASLLTASTIQSSHIKSNSIVSTIIDATTITASDITTSTLSALTANMGDITAGTLKGGTIPDANASPSGTESGAFMDLTGGKMVFGNASKHVLFDGSNLVLSGVTIDANSIVNTSATPELIVQEDGSNKATAADTLNFTTGINVSVSGNTATISADSSALDHDSLVGFVANEHIDHSGVTLTAGNGLTGGGDITASRSFAVGAGTGISVAANSISTNDSAIVHDNLSGFVANEHIDHSTISLTAGDGLTGGGDITGDRSFAVDATVVRTSAAQTIAGVKTFSNGIVASGGISGLTLTSGISGSNYNITGVNELQINDPGEGIKFTAGSSGNMVLAIVDDASDNILRYSGTNAVFDVQGNITLSGTVDGRDIATDGTKLDTVDENANNYSLPTATASALGGVKIGSGININSGVISAATQSDENFTSAFKTKLTNIEVNANNYSLPTATSSSLGGVKIGAGINIDANGAITASTQSDENFTSAFKTKLTNIETNANNYTLPEATSTVLGGVKDGARVTIDANGVLSADVQTANDFTNALKNKLDNIEENANEYSLPVASPTVLGGVKIGSGISISSGTISADTQSDQNFTSTLKTKLDNIEANATADQSASEIRTLLGTATSSTSGLVKIGYTENNKNYPVELSSGQMFVNVPWTDNNTTYTAGSGLSLSGSNEFSVNNTVVRTSGAQTIAGNKTFSNNVIVSGNLTVSGTTTYINTQTLNIGDNIITLNADYTGSTPTESAGIEVERGTQANALFQYKESGVGITGDTAAGWSVGTSRLEATGFYGTFYGDASNLSNINADSLSGLSTADLAEDPSATTTSGTMYYTDTRVIAALSGGSGIDKSAGGEFAVDSTVVRTSGTQTIGGAKTLTSNLTVGTTTDSTYILFPDKNVLDNPTAVGDKRKLIAMGDSGNGGLWQTTGRGGLMLASADDSLILASGDVGRSYDPDAGGYHPNPDNEEIYLLTDGSVRFMTNLQTASAYKQFIFDSSGNATIPNNIVVGGTVDGRDLATDGAKLDNIAANATNTAAPAITTNGSTPSLASGITAAEVRTVIGAGTSSLTLGTTSTTALRGDTAIPTVYNPAITLSAGNAGITMDSDNSFTLNQSGAETITISHADTSSQASVNNSSGTVIQDITLDTFGHITAINSTDLDGRYFTETESDTRYLRKDSYDSNWTRLGYGTSGTAYWHKLAEVTINGSYKDYQLRCDWTDRYNHGTLNIHIHSDNDNTADIWDAYVQQFGQTNRKASSHFKYYKSGSTVQVWIYTPGWREWDYIRTDAVTEGTPTIVWYKEGDSGAGKTTTEPSGLTEFSDYTPWHLNNDGPSSGLNADTLHGAAPSMVAGNSTIVQRNANGYVFANYFNTTANDVSSGVTKIMVETGNDNYIRHGDASAVRGFINVANGADVTPSWVPSSNPGYVSSLSDLSITSTATEINKLDGFTGVTADLNYAKDLRATGVTSTEFDYLDGVSDNIQTQLNGKQASGNYITSLGDLNITSTSTEINKLDGFTGVTADLNYAKDLRATGVTSTEFDYLDGVTSSIQTQLNGKQASLGFTPYNATNPNGYITNSGGTTASTANTVVKRDSAGDINARLFRSEYDTTNATIGYIMTQINTGTNNYIRPSTPAQVRSGLNVADGADVTPSWVPSTNPNYLTGITSSQVTGALGFTPYNATNPNGYITGISSSDVTTALGFTPYNATNPNGYITNSGGTTAATANTVAKRTGSADIRARLFRSNYANQNTISGAMAFRVNNGTDDYIRFCSDAAAIRTFIGAGTSSTTGTVTSVSGGTGLSGTVTTSGSLNLTNTGVSAATYGNSTNIPQIAVDAQGRITSASNVAVSIPSGANNATITLTAGNGLTTGGSFTTDQSSNDTITFNVGAGDGISVAANAVAVDSTVLRAGTGTLINDIINANVITADMIQANSIVATIITAEEITASHIATNTITANEIQAGAITASELQISNNASGSAGIFMDYNSGNSRIDIRDSSALRVRIGYLA